MLAIIFGDVDVLLGIPTKSHHEKAQYKQLTEDAGALVIEFGDSSVIVASLQAIIRSKSIADRAKDHEALPELRALAAARGVSPPPLPSRPPQRSSGPRPVGYKR